MFSEGSRPSESSWLSSISGVEPAEVAISSCFQSVIRSYPYTKCFNFKLLNLTSSVGRTEGKVCQHCALHQITETAFLSFPLSRPADTVKNDIVVN